MYIHIFPILHSLMSHTPSSNALSRATACKKIEAEVEKIFKKHARLLRIEYAFDIRTKLSDFQSFRVRQSSGQCRTPTKQPHATAISRSLSISENKNQSTQYSGADILSVNTPVKIQNKGTKRCTHSNQSQNRTNLPQSSMQMHIPIRKPVNVKNSLASISSNGDSFKHTIQTSKGQNKLDSRVEGATLRKYAIESHFLDRNHFSRRVVANNRHKSRPVVVRKYSLKQSTLSGN